MIAYPGQKLEDAVFSTKEPPAEFPSFFDLIGK